MVFQCRIFEVLDARIASAVNKIIHNSQFKRRISLEEQKAQKQDRFLRGRQIAYLIYEQFWVTGTHDSVENYTDLFTIVLRNDDIQEFDSKWDGTWIAERYESSAENCRPTMGQGIHPKMSRSSVDAHRRRA